MTNYSINNGTFYLAHGDHKQGFDAKALAQAANISIKTAYKWINGTQNPDPAKLELMVYKVLGILPCAPEYRLVDGKLHHHSIKRPLPLTAWAAIDYLYTLNEMNQAHTAETDSRLAAMKKENGLLKARLYELSMAIVAQRDHDVDISGAFVAPRDFTPEHKPKLNA